MEKYGFGLESRANQIDYWLRENDEKWTIQNFVILDDCDENLSVRFPKNFVYVIRGLFSEAHAKEAYKILTQAGL